MDVSIGIQQLILSVSTSLLPLLYNCILFCNCAPHFVILSRFATKPGFATAPKCIQQVYKIFLNIIIRGVRFKINQLCNPATLSHIFKLIAVECM